MRLMTLHHVHDENGAHEVTVDKQTGTSGKSIFTVKIDGKLDRHAADAKEAVVYALRKVFPK